MSSVNSVIQQNNVASSVNLGTKVIKGNQQSAAVSSLGTLQQQQLPAGLKTAVPTESTEVFAHQHNVALTAYKSYQKDEGEQQVSLESSYNPKDVFDKIREAANNSLNGAASAFTKQVEETVDPSQVSTISQVKPTFNLPEVNTGINTFNNAPVYQTASNALNSAIAQGYQPVGSSLGERPSSLPPAATGAIKKLSSDVVMAAISSDKSSLDVVSIEPRKVVTSTNNSTTGTGTTAPATPAASAPTGTPVAQTTTPEPVVGAGDPVFVDEPRTPAANQQPQQQQQTVQPDARVVAYQGTHTDQNTAADESAPAQGATVAPSTTVTPTQVGAVDQTEQGQGQDSEQDKEQGKQSGSTTASEKKANGEEFTEEELAEIEQLKARDEEVRTHEQAHKSAGGQYAGAPSYGYTTGPDGKRYATEGEVSIDISEEADPQATIDKMQQVKRAAMAPAEPSSQDRVVYNEATQIESQARQELRQQEAEERSEAAKPAEESSGKQGQTKPATDNNGNDQAQPQATQAQPAAQEAQPAARSAERSGRAGDDAQNANTTNAAPVAQNAQGAATSATQAAEQAEAQRSDNSSSQYVVAPRADGSSSSSDSSNSSSSSTSGSSSTTPEFDPPKATGSVSRSLSANEEEVGPDI